MRSAGRLSIRSLAKYLACVALAMAALLWTRTGAAHDLEIDRLTLSIDPRLHQLRGQIELDPELTRHRDEPHGPIAEQRLSRFLEEHLMLEADGQRLTPKLSVRELWVRGGATAGDLVMIQAALPSNARTLRARVPPAMKALVVSVRQMDADGSWRTHSTLAFGGDWTESYGLDAPASARWRKGGAEQFSLDALEGVAASPSSSAKAEPAAATPRSEGLPRENGWREAWRYLVLGFEHIVPKGLDHVLFVIGLVLASRRLKPLLVQLTAFTLAHSVTLALGALGLVVLPRAIVEPLIALSICFVAVENLLDRGEPKYRPLVVLLFGLLHGQGFASVLSDLALPRHSFVAALASFNIGVELGQLVVVATALLVLRLIRDPRALRTYAVVPGSVLIAAAGLYWSVQRLLG